MRTVLGCAAVFVLACGVVAGQPDAKKLIGKWETTDKKALMLIEFTADGKIYLTSGPPGTELKVDGTYKLDKDKLAVQLKFPGEEVKETLTVKKLTDDELITEDSKQKAETLKRKK